MKSKNQSEMTYQKGHKKGQKLIQMYQNQPEFDAKKCTVGELNAFLGISQRRIQQLTKVKILKKTGHGEYNLLPCLQSYLKYLKRLLRRYMGLYRYCIEVHRKRRTNFRKLPFYGDLEPFPEEDFLRIFDKKEQE